MVDSDRKCSHHIVPCLIVTNSCKQQHKLVDEPIIATRHRGEKNRGTKTKEIANYKQH